MEEMATTQAQAHDAVDRRHGWLRVTTKSMENPENGDTQESFRIFSPNDSTEQQIEANLGQFISQQSLAQQAELPLISP